MKKLLFSLGIIILFTFYVLFSNQNSTPRTPPAQTVSLEKGQSSGTSTDSTSTTTSSSGANPSATPQAPITATSAYKDGTYKGSVENAFYGNVQVAAVIQNGRLTDVKSLAYPSDNGHSLEVSNFALPTLKQEAIQSQSANVDAVSGATATSQAFQQSLATALTQAKN